MVKFYSFLLLCFVIAGGTYAANIKGIVTDKASDEPIVGAVVRLAGTSFGTTTGLDGSYDITNIPAGSYDLEILYSSYETFKQHISLEQSQTITANAVMATTSHVLTEVQVTGKLANGSDEQARNIEKNSDNTMNIMSARTIELLPDITIANVLQRVSGIQVERNANGDARYATIRGMDKRYNYTSVDGVVIPSPDDVGRYVPLDIFPAEIVDRIEVIKSLTPDMEGNAIGGVTNLVTKKAPDHLVVYASAATGYNENLFDQSYKSFYKGSVQPNDPATTHGQSYMANVTDLPLSNSIIRPIQAPPNSLYSLSLGNRFLKDKKLGIMFSGSYQNTYKETNDIFFAPASEPSQFNVDLFDDLNIRKYFTQETRSAAHLNVDYRFNDKNTITFYGLYAQLNKWQERNVIDTVLTAVNRPGPGLGTVDYKDRTTFTKQDIGNLTLKGDHVIASGLKLDWTGAYSKAKQDVPDYTEFSSEDNFSRDPQTGGIDEEGRILKSASKSWERTNDEDLQGFLNLNYNTDVFGQYVELKAGGMYRSKNRDNYYNEYSLNTAGGHIPFTNVQSINESDDFNFVGANPQGDNNGQSYSERENVSGYYAQGKIHLLDDKLEALIGVRIEHTHLHDSLDQDPHIVPAVAGTYDYTDVLPGLHLKYKLSKKENIRFSYYESISRPGFADLLNNYVKTETFDLYGNPYLEHAVAQNFDVRYELFPRGLDQVLIGAFVKDISNNIEYYLRSNGTSAQKIMPANDTNNAINYGAEIVVTKYFHYFGVSANYTYTHSSVTVPAAYLGQNPAHPTQYQVYDYTETRPLQGQAAHVGNLALIYKNPKLGFDANLSLQYTGRFISIASPWQGLDYWQKATTFLDFACDKQIIKHLSVYAKVQNILNTKTIVEMNESNTIFTDPNGVNAAQYFAYQNLKDHKTLVEQSQTGRNYLIGIRYKFN